MIENRSSKSCAPAGFTCVTVHAVTNPIAIPERTRMIASKQSDNASSWASVPPDETFPMRVGGKVNMGLVGNCVHAPQQWNYREERWAIWTIGRPIGAGLVECGSGLGRDLGREFCVDKHHIPARITPRGDARNGRPRGLLV